MKPVSYIPQSSRLLDDVKRPTRPRRIPSVLSSAEVAALFGAMTGVELLLAKLLYGTGMRLNEGLRLRIKDVDFDRRVLVVREGPDGAGSRDMGA